MKVRILGCYGGCTSDNNLTSFLINSTLLLDAGSASQTLSIEEQRSIDAVVLTHTHLDHILSIPFIADNMKGARDRPIDIISHPSVIQPFKHYILNDKIWPDFTQIPHYLKPVLRLKEIDDNREFEACGLKIRGIKVSHAIPTYGFIVRDNSSAIVYTGDTAPTKKIWEAVNREKGIKAIITEVSYSNRMTKVADISRHMTPALLAEEIKKVNDSNIPFYIYHMKPQYMEEIKKEIKSLNMKNVNFLQQGKTYNF